MIVAVGDPITGLNGGTLTAGNPGNKGGGRTSNAARAMVREEFTPEVVAELKRMATSKDSSDDIKLRTIKVMADIGIAKEIEVASPEVAEALRRVYAALATYYAADPDEYERVAAAVSAGVAG